MTMSTTLKLSLLSRSYGALYAIIHKGGNGQIVKRRTNGADMFITALVTEYGETKPDIDLVQTGEKILGVVIGPASDQGEGLNLAKDSDSCFADNTWVNVYIPEPGDELLLTWYTNTAGNQGVLQKLQTGTGMIGGDFAYSNAAVATDTLIDVVGTCVVAVTATGSTEKVSLLRWGNL
jgi:hypothetical protein